jgi:FixJ family two-component response regulator
MLASHKISAALKRVFMVGFSVGASEIRDPLAREEFELTRYIDSGAFISADHEDNVGCLVIETLGADGLDVEFLDYAKSAAHRLAIVVLADGEQVHLAVRALRAGAYDVLQRPTDPERLVDAIRSALTVLEGRPAFEPTLERLVALKALAGLTDRQRDILGRIVQGQSNKVIAIDIGVSQRTIDNHRAAIMKKMGVSSAPALIKRAIAAR